MADKEFNMEELRKELQEAVKDAFGDGVSENAEQISEGTAETVPDGATREYPLEDIKAALRKQENEAAENAASAPEMTDTQAENISETAAENIAEITAETENAAGIAENAAEEAGKAADAAAETADAAAETADAAKTAENRADNGTAAAENEAAAAENTADTAENAAMSEADAAAEEIVAVTSEPLKAERYEEIEAAVTAAAAAAVQEAQPSASAETGGAGNTENTGMAQAYDREALARAVMASQEKVAMETEQNALNEVKKKKKRQKAKRTARNLGLTFVLLAFLAGVAGGAYFYMARYYATRFLSGTYINGKDVSGLTTAEVKKDLFGVTDTYSLTIHERGGKTEELNAKQLGRSYIDNNQVETLMEEQENNKWLFHLSDEKVYEVTFDMAYDKKMAREAIDHLQCFIGSDIVAPKDAKLSTDTNGTYIVLPEEMGNTLDEQKAKEMITAALDKAASDVDLEEGDCYLKPEIYSDDEKLNKRANAWNAYLSVNVTYSFGSNKETVDAETVRPYITDNGFDVYLATDWVKTLVYAWGQKYDSFGLEREFTTHDGVTIKIPAGGDYGWCINKEKTIEDVTQCVLNGTTGEREPVWLFKAMGWDNNDITGTYCEVSIKDQHLWCYKNGVCVMDTDVVTGKPTAERMTFTGCFAIDGKKRDAVLGRLDVQGYASPVSYWLPFNGGEGLHDAPWRSNFGGDIYKSNGSHGCVNIPESKMETIFNALEIGNAVIVYDDKTPVSAAATSQDNAENAGEG